MKVISGAVGVLLATISSCGGASKSETTGGSSEVTIEMKLVRTVDAPPAGMEGLVSPDAAFVPYKEFAWNDWLHSGDCVMKNMNAKYYKNGVIKFSGDARSEDTNDCWNPFSLDAYNGAGAHLHNTGNRPYCMQDKSKDFPVRWDDNYPEAFFNELQKVVARGKC